MKWYAGLFGCLLLLSGCTQNAYVGNRPSSFDNYHLDGWILYYPDGECVLSLMLDIPTQPQKLPESVCAELRKNRQQANANAETIKWLRNVVREELALDHAKEPTRSTMPSAIPKDVPYYDHLLTNTPR